ncbi:Kua-ubiquitin conjugating enzyme hybrid localization domain-containing protein [Baffinella frigidus]|nr:Kua-ubiquitin conjugating enzyme hybrid localization domain-containing protein [Cryptophyta sp. CCMP2293]
MLESTDEQRKIVYGSFALLAALFLKGVFLLPDTNIVVGLEALAAILVGYEFADVGSGIYHWSMDNYGTAKTPVFGTQIEAFQGHHELPWTITHRQVSNNIYKICQSTAPVCVLGLLAVDDPLVLLWASTAISFINLSQELHKWSHQSPAQSAGWINFLQENQLIVSRKTHLLHHRAPFDGNYCIVSGHCNAPLDNIGFFRALEQVVYKVTGNEARCWNNERLLQVHPHPEP